MAHDIDQQDPAPTSEQYEIACVLMRGGTSKALFFHDADLPSAGPHRDALLKRIMGSPDPLQIDGMGGSRLVTSKVAIVRQSDRPDADVDYTFAQIDTDRDLIGYEGNCGNVSAAVGPYAIDEGLVTPVEPVTVVRIYNTNTDKVLSVHVPVGAGRARVFGSCQIAGVPGSGAEILMDYSGTVGAKTGSLLPTGNITDDIILEDGRIVTVSICDVANPCVFVRAQTLGTTAARQSPMVTDSHIIDVLCEIQAKAGAAIGLWPDWRLVQQPGLPLAILVDGPTDHVDLSGNQHLAASMDIQARLVFLGKCHDSMAGTGALCTAAAACISGSVAWQAATPVAQARRLLRIAHPSGIMYIDVAWEKTLEVPGYRFPVLGLARTARRLMAGNVYVPRVL